MTAFSIFSVIKIEKSANKAITEIIAFSHNQEKLKKSNIYFFIKYKLTIILAFLLYLCKNYLKKETLSIKYIPLLTFHFLLLTFNFPLILCKNYLKNIT